MSAVDLRAWIAEHSPGSALIDLVDQLLKALPIASEFQRDRWNIVGWKMRPGNGRALYLYFDKISNSDLRVVSKIWVLHGRHAGNVAHGAAFGRVDALTFLDRVVGNKPLRKLNNADFLKAEKLLRTKRSEAGAYGLSKTLGAFSAWLNLRTGLRLSYVSRIKKRNRHGRGANDIGRREKLIPDQVIRDLIGANKRDDISQYDRFFLQILVLDVGAGFRVGELAHLPAECLLEENGALQILYLPEKRGKPVPKVVPPSLAPAVRQAVENLQLWTADARATAEAWRRKRPLDWRAISDNEEAACYFVGKFAHEWTADPNNQLATASGAYHRYKRKYFDVVGMLQECDGNLSELARRLDVTWMALQRMLREQQSAMDGRPIALMANGQLMARFVGDRRAINEKRIKLHTGTTVYRRYASVRSIVKEAQSFQMRGETFPQPTHSAEMEAAYRRSFTLVRDVNGKSILEAHEALLLKHRPGKEDDFLAITANDLAKWLYKKGQGSVFERLGIIDPRTNAIAKFTWHDVRHWLDTQFERGGLTQQQIALIFGRKDVRQNSVYDQTSSRERASRLQDAVRNGQLVGLISDTYSRLADISRDEAEQYLEAAMRMVNIMPHGLCTLNWAMSPCPHFLSCFTCGGDQKDEGPCEHLLVDGNDRSQVEEVRRLRREAQTALGVVPRESPMFDHYLRVFTNTSLKLERLGVGVGND